LHCGFDARGAFCGRLFRRRFMKIIIASTRAAKIDAARLAVARIAAIDARWGAAEILACAVDTDAPAMPLSDEEMLRGAQARAHGALEIWRRETHGAQIVEANAQPGSADDEIFFVGLEGGLHTIAFNNEPQTFLRGWACVTDGMKMSFGASGSILVPRAIVRRVVNEGRELGVVIDEVAGARDVRSRQGAWGVLSRDLIARAQSFETALVAAFAPFYNKIYDSDE
jgi:non-canonical (house-cleaning) NTP pyrophosphatase